MNPSGPRRRVLETANVLDKVPRGQQSKAKVMGSRGVSPTWAVHTQSVILGACPLERQAVAEIGGRASPGRNKMG
jgi:hypothetical protein